MSGRIYTFWILILILSQLSLLHSGESWVSGTGWKGDSKLPDISIFTKMCVSKGVEIIGGCCRVTSPQIKTMRQAIDSLC